MKKEISKEEFKRELDSYIDLCIDTNCLVTSPSGKKEVYVSVGTFLDTMREEFSILKKGDISLKKIEVFINEDLGYHKHIIVADFYGEEKQVAIQTKILTDNQSRTLCEKISNKFKEYYAA